MKIRHKCAISEMFQDLTNNLSCMKLVAVECKWCEEVEVKDVKYMLAKIPTLAYCIVDVQLRCLDDIKSFAELANELAGQVNLSLVSLEPGMNTGNIFGPL